MRRIACAAAFVLVGVTAAACDGIGTSDVHRVAPSAVPLDLLSPAGPGTSTATPRGPVIVAYLLDDDRLVAVRRRAVGANVTADAIRALLTGPTVADAQDGLVSAVPSGTHLLSLDVKDRVATIDLSEQFGTVADDRQTLAVAQLVYTVTTSASVGAVRFKIDGDPIDTPDGSGAVASAPRTRTDFARFAPR